MPLSVNIDKLLNCDTKNFEDFLKKLFKKNLDNANEELELKYKFNQKLYEAIEFTLKKLKEEENIISRVLYSSFGIGEHKNKRRRHLILLGTQLKIEIDKLRRDIQRVNYLHKNNILSSKVLNDIREGFSQKIYNIDNHKLSDRRNKYLKEIYLITDEVNKSMSELDLKSIYLETTLDKYKILLKQIPRYSELKDEKYLEYKSK